MTELTINGQASPVAPGCEARELGRIGGHGPVVVAVFAARAMMGDLVEGPRGGVPQSLGVQVSRDMVERGPRRELLRWIAAYIDAAGG